MQLEQTRAQTTMGIEQSRQAAEAQKEQFNAQTQMQIAQFQAEQAQQLELIKQQAETERARIVAEIQAAKDIQIAELQLMLAKSEEATAQLEQPEIE